MTDTTKQPSWEKEIDEITFNADLSIVESKRLNKELKILISSEITKARIEENKYWIKRGLTYNYYARDYLDRIREIKDGKA